MTLHVSQYFVEFCYRHQAIPVARWSKVWVFSCSLAGTAGSNLAGGIDVSLLWVLFVIMQKSVSG
jgi:hypothetical protein